MEKIKNQRFICLLWIAVLSMAIQLRLYSQDYLSKERENEIKMSGRYYWGEGSDFVEEMAKLSAFVELSNQVIQDAVGQSDQLDEILKAIDMGAHLEKLPLQGKIKILAWIAKDSVLLTVTTQRPITRNEQKQTAIAPVTQKEQESAPQSELVSINELNPVVTNNAVLHQLAACKTYNDVRRVATRYGLVRGQIGSGSKGFHNPENCIIAVFSSDGSLSALLDTGGNSRTDVLSGNSLQNPEQNYTSEGFYLLYMQQKNIPQSEESYIQDDNSPSINTSQQPKENTTELSNSPTSTSDPDVVVINGIQWAKRNVDKPGTFAATPEATGMFYQWNNKVGWSATNPLISTTGGRQWDNNQNSYSKDRKPITRWATNNDPCAKGWRLPSGEELSTLLDTEKVTSEWTTQNGVKGRKFSNKSTGQSIFLPAAGYREDHSVEFIPDVEKLHSVGEKGIYWSSNANEVNWVYCLNIYSEGLAVRAEVIFQNSAGLTIRCVKE